MVVEMLPDFLLVAQQAPWKRTDYLSGEGIDTLKMWLLQYGTLSDIYKVWSPRALDLHLSQ